MSTGKASEEDGGVAVVVSFLDALKGRYGAEDDINSYNPNDFLVGDRGRRRNKTWQLVGMEKTRAKQSRYDRLVDVVLRDQGITVAVKDAERRDGTTVREGEKEAFQDDLAAQRMVSVKELDLSENVKLPLSEVAKLLPYFPRLDTLQLCDTPKLLPAVSDSLDGHAAVLSSAVLRKLVLNNAGLSSMVQLRSLVDLPNLEELHLDANAIECLTIAATAEEAALLARNGEGWLRMPRVHTLSLAQNSIDSWRTLAETLPKAFPALQRLFLTGNKLPNLLPPQLAATANTGARAAAGLESGESTATPTSASVPSCPEGAGPAPEAALGFMRSLTLLCLNENLTITDTRTIDAIRVRCPSLDTFRITYSTLLPHWNDTLSRMFVVASLPTVQTLNRAQVRPKERLDSEIFYIQRGLAQREAIEAAQREDDEAAAAAVKEQFKDEPEYPLLDVLKEKHKDLVMSIYKEGATASSDGSSHLMLDVRLRCENNYKRVEGGEALDLQRTAPNVFHEVSKTLPSSLSIAKLKALIRVAFQIDPIHQEISYRSGDEGVLERPVAMQNDLQTLGYYGVGNGAIITVRDLSLR